MMNIASKLVKVIEMKIDWLSNLKHYLYSIPITFNNPLKVCFSNKKNNITTQTRPTQIVK